MPKPNAQAPPAGADAGRTRVDARRSRTRVQPSGATDGITITRWSLGLSLTIALTVVTAAFTLVWNQTVRLGETQIQLVASVTGLNERTTGLDTRVAGFEMRVAVLETRMTGLEARMVSLETRMAGVESEVRALRDEVRELADLIRERDLPGPLAQ